LRRLVVLALLALLIGSALASAATAATRRALLVGINEYADGSDGDARWTDLRGSRNDVEAMRAILVSRFGFAASDVRVLTDGAATRDAILAGLRDQLVEPAQPGDVSVFFYAGHGSQVRNPDSSERDGLDETIVPADSNRGAPDIRDKELRALFNDALDRGARMIAVFDSCNSGSITRAGAPGGRSRYLPPATGSRAAFTPGADDPRPPPEQRGALIFSAAGDDQEARETLDDSGHVRGAFSLALTQALRATPGDETAERIYRRTAALLSASQVGQVPVLAAAPEWRRRPLLAAGEARSAGAPLAAVVSVDGRTALLDGGVASGLNPGAELVGAGSASDGLRLRVESSSGVSRAHAVLVAGELGALRPGALFQLDRWAAPKRAALRVAIDAAPADENASRSAQTMLGELRGLPELGWVDDPSVTTPSHRMLFQAGGWRLHGPGGQQHALGLSPSAIAVRSAVAERPGAPTRLFASLPPTLELAEELRARTRESSGVTLVEDGSAHYRLVGRMDGAGASYAWIGGDTSLLGALPARSDWQPFPVRAGGALDLASALEESALRIAQVRAWLTLDAPPDAGDFPYHLALRAPGSGQLLMGGAVFEGDEYQLVLERAGAAGSAAAARRYVYVFAIDGGGRRALLFPPAASGNVENRFPVARGPDGAAPQVIPLGTTTLRIAPPFGTDTLVMVSSETPLADPAVLEGAPVRTRGTASTGGGLDALLGSVGELFGLAPTAPTPPTWSLDRLTLHTRPRPN